ncbi:MAG TPA: hypothetical protein VG028_17180 [Terriglobia bacterium]|nr:hypothetical protein [Terriglobia bacterium]
MNVTSDAAPQSTGLRWHSYASPLRLAVVGVYVDFYESIADVKQEKRRCFTGAVTFLETQGRVVLNETVATAGQAEEVNQRLQDLRPDIVVVIPLVAVFGALSFACVQRLECPILIWSLQLDSRVTSDYDLPTLIRNSGTLGATALANTLVRNGQKFRVICSAGEAASGSPALARLFAAARAAAALRTARIAVIGKPFAEMSDVILNPVAFQDTLGASFVTVSADELAQRCAGVQDHEVIEARRQLQHHFATEDLAPSEMDRSLRLLVALDSLAVEHQLSAGALNCHGANCIENPAIGVTACYAVSLLTSAGCPFSCTGDLCTAVAMHLLKTLSGTSQYVELDMLDEPGDFVLLANGGEADLTLAKGKPKVVGNQNFKGLHGRGASFDFVPQDGVATLLSYTPSHSSFRGRLIVAAGSVEAIQLDRLKLYHHRFRFSGCSALRGFERWCEAGAVHHAALSLGDWTVEILWVASLLGLEVERV